MSCCEKLQCILSLIEKIVFIFQLSHPCLKCSSGWLMGTIILNDVHCVFNHYYYNAFHKKNVTKMYSCVKKIWHFCPIVVAQFVNVTPYPIVGNAQILKL